MIMKHVFINILFIVFLVFKVSAGVVCNHPVLKINFQIFILQLKEINLAHMECPFCALQNRGGEHFTHRNIYISNTVFKYGFFFWIFQAVQLYFQIRLILSFSKNMHIFPFVQSIDKCLLHLSVNFRIQSIDTDYLIENLRIVIADFRYGIGNDCKTSFIAFDVLVRDLT